MQPWEVHETLCSWLQKLWGQDVAKIVLSFHDVALFDPLVPARSIYNGICDLEAPYCSPHIPRFPDIVYWLNDAGGFKTMWIKTPRENININLLSRRTVPLCVTIHTRHALTVFRAAIERRIIQSVEIRSCWPWDVYLDQVDPHGLLRDKTQWRFRVEFHPVEDAQVVKNYELSIILAVQFDPQGPWFCFEDAEQNFPERVNVVHRAVEKNRLVEK